MPQHQELPPQRRLLRKRRSPRQGHHQPRKAAVEKEELRLRSKKNQKKRETLRPFDERAEPLQTPILELPLLAPRLARRNLLELDLAIANGRHILIKSINFDWKFYSSTSISLVTSSLLCVKKLARGKCTKVSQFRAYLFCGDGKHAKLLEFGESFLDDVLNQVELAARNVVHRHIADENRIRVKGMAK